MRRPLLALIGLALLVPGGAAPLAQRGRPSDAPGAMSSGLALLSPTIHPQIPRDLSSLWLAPDRGTVTARTAAATSVGSAAKLTTDGEFTKALTLVSQPSVRDGVLGPYAVYVAGIAQLRLDRASDALASFRTLQAQKPVGFLGEAAQLGDRKSVV